VQMRLMFCLFLLSLPLSIDGRGGRGGGGRGRMSHGRSRSGGKWGYGQGKTAHRTGVWSGGGGMGNRAGMGGSSGGQTYVSKQSSSYYRAGVGSISSSTVAKTSIALAAYPLATRVFGNNVIRDREAPLKVDGVSYYWSSSYIPESNSTSICTLPVDANDTLFNNITFSNLERVTELAWTCLSTSYCCGLSCCSVGYEGIPLRSIGRIGMALLVVTAIFIPGVAVLNGFSTVNGACRLSAVEEENKREGEKRRGRKVEWR
ncbi:hypothetical protein PMAYCL1PPCAC_11899, partial [Pristionchus mayeri]